MSDAPDDRREFSWLRLLPGLRLFRALGVSLDAKKWLLAALGLLLLRAGWWGLDRLLLIPDSQAFATRVGPGPTDVADWRTLAAPLIEPAAALSAPFAAFFSFRRG